MYIRHFLLLDLLILQAPLHSSFIKSAAHTNQFAIIQY